MARLLVFRSVRLIMPVLAVLLASALAVSAADRDRLRAFLAVTGFDKAIESLQDSAVAGPALVGDAPDAFGQEWERLAREIFDREGMIERALDMMEAVMPDDLVAHGAEFYASDLGQRLVAVENAALTVPDEERYGQGQLIVADLLENNPARIDILRDMTEAIGGIDQTVRQVIEVQVRYLMAAMAAGASDLEVDEADLRAMLQEQAPEIARNVEVFSVMGSAYTYRDISDADLAAYLEALRDPRMRQVYEVLNAIQFEVMAERYERLAAALAGLPPQTDL